MSLPSKFGDIEILPGKHEVEFGYEVANGRSIDNAVVTFEAKANHEYEARAEFDTDVFTTVFGGRGTWRGTVTDLGERKVTDDPVVSEAGVPENVR